MNQGRVLLAAFEQFRAEFRKDPTALFHWIAVGMRNIATDVPLSELLAVGFASSEIASKRVTNLVAVGSIGTEGGASIVNLPSPNPVFEDVAADGYILPKDIPAANAPSGLALGGQSGSRSRAPRRMLLIGVATRRCCWRSARSCCSLRDDDAPGEGRRKARRTPSEGDVAAPTIPAFRFAKATRKVDPHLAGSIKRRQREASERRRGRGPRHPPDLYTEGFLDPANWRRGRYADAFEGVRERGARSRRRRAPACSPPALEPATDTSRSCRCRGASTRGSCWIAPGRPALS